MSRSSPESLPESTELVRRFLAERCEVSPAYRVPRAELHAAWRAWCALQQRPATAASAVGRRLRAAVPGLGGARVRVAGVTVGHYTGLRLAAPLPPPAVGSAGGTGASFMLAVLLVAGDRLEDAVLRLIDRLGTDGGSPRLLDAVSAVITAAVHYSATASNRVAAVVEWADTQTTRLSDACQEACAAAALVRARADRAEAALAEAHRGAARSAADLRAAESIVARVLGAGFSRRTGIVTLPGATDGPPDPTPDA